MKDINHLQQIINDQSDQKLKQVIALAFKPLENLPSEKEIDLSELLLIGESNNVPQLIEIMKKLIFDSNKEKFRKSASREVARKVVDDVLPF